MWLDYGARTSCIASASCDEPQLRLAYYRRMPSIHARIKERRQALKMSQEKLAGEIGVTYQTVQQWEREPGVGPDGKPILSTAPSRARLAKVAAILGVTQHWLLTGEDHEGQKLDPTTSQLVMMYEGVSEESRDTLLQFANRLYSLEHPGKSAANPFSGKRPPKRRK